MAWLDYIEVPVRQKSVNDIGERYYETPARYHNSFKVAIPPVSWFSTMSKSKSNDIEFQEAFQTNDSPPIKALSPTSLPLRAKDWAKTQDADRAKPFSPRENVLAFVLHLGKNSLCQ